MAAVLARVPDLQRALDVVRLLHGPAEQAPAWLAVVRETAAGGDHTAALALVEAMKHRPSRAEAAGVLAQVRARNGEHEQALALAETIPYPHARLLAWAMLAQAAADSGDHPWTLEFLDRAERVETGHDEWTAPAIPVLIRAAAAVGDRDRTLAWIERLEEVARRESAARTALRAGRDESRSKTSPLSDTPTLQPLLRTVAGVGEHERAKALLKSVRGKAPRAVATAAAARACAQYGDRVRALRLARSIEDPGHRAGALAAVADAAARAGDVDMINAVGELVTNGEQLVDAAAVLAVGEAWARVGAADRAEAWIRSIRTPALRHEARAVVAEGLAVAGAFERAEALARTLGDPELCAEVLAEVVSALALAGSTGQAEAVACSIQRSTWRARALAVVAVHAQDPDARRLVVPALERGDWPSVIEVLARVEPAAVAAIADESLLRAADRRR
ncbi:hypothetical protein [Streptomyces sp. NPDC023588]|uniref:hypothetical protein n=1 Tax=Streptomyces sp. NPDC023588 TaxID=3154907 RepID=UPI003404CD9E